MGDELDDVVTDGGWGWVEELKMVMSAEVDEALGLPNMISIGSWSKCIDSQSACGSF